MEKTLAQRLRETERDLEAQREWNVGLVRKLHDMFDEAGNPPTPIRSVATRLEEVLTALKDEKRTREVEAGLNQGERDDLHKLFDKTGVSFMALYYRIERVVEIVEELRKTNIRLAKEAEESQKAAQDLRRENEELQNEIRNVREMAGVWERQVAYEKSLAVNAGIERSRARQEGMRRLNAALRIVETQPLAPGTLVGSRQKWLKREILTKLENLLRRPW